MPVADPTVASLMRVVGACAALDVWFGTAGDHSELEADVREVSERGLAGISALAMALGEVAKRHKLEVRVIPRLGAEGPTVLVLFGARTHRAR